MVQFIDRRLNGKNKSAVNRQRFLRRHKKQIKESVANAANRRSITNIDSCEDISIPRRDIREPIFRQGDGGTKERIHPGNDQFVFGDKIKRSKTKDSDKGTTNSEIVDEDEFVFQISKDEYLDLLFENLELPNFKNNQMNKMIKWKTHRAGFQTKGVPFNISIIHSLQRSFARRTAMSANKKKKLSELEIELNKIQSIKPNQVDEEQRLKQEIESLRKKIESIPFIDTFDLRFKNYKRQPILSNQAVMFCLMDVSGSMDKITKDIAKRFYILLYLFLTRTYKNVDVVFIRHHTQAKEVNEHDFFYSTETGGTLVSSALKLMQKITQDTDRYPIAEWNIYAAQASDGDNWADDSPNCRELLLKKLLPNCQYYSYIEITKRPHQTLWHEYEKVEQSSNNFAMKNIKTVDDIFPIFRELFKKEIT
ncbi:hypothetical protein CF67_04045 [Candidatus Photodesmus blepharus]|uniref:UPF0229 protein CF67_04045 n=1 Tax=Candidatus Photodesmus blepharonis TaxID=1179155 RepID=A0A084CMN1_9GAMM|nr:YeaH/YhbH family protein [Candidatus Photodesmus blepharus]KEY91060.1 hypothetical protein CF67_04045 [Candidatus Photodesmus blepharus]